MPKASTFWALVLLLAACQNDGAGPGSDPLPSSNADFQRVEGHPHPDSIPAVTDPRFIIRDVPRDTLFWIGNALRGGRTIGKAEGDLDEMLGTIRDVAVSDSFVYYADGNYSHVRAYDFEGHLVDILGGPGEGPGEMSWVSKVSVTGSGDSVYVVVGSGQYKISVFRRRRDGTHEFRNSFSSTVDFFNGAMCAMHGHVYTTGYKEDLSGVIHKHTLEGAYVSSFGARYNHEARIVRSNIAEWAILECNATHRTLLHLQKQAPIATAFTESGAVIWRIKFSDARIALATAHYWKNRPYRVSIGQGIPWIGESRAPDIVGGASGDTFWLTRRELLSEERDRWVGHLYKVDVLSGRGEYVGPRPFNHTLQAGRRIQAIAQERLFVSRMTPFPQLGIHRMPSEIR